MNLKVLSKWQPILDNLTIKKEYHQLFAEYCEQHINADCIFASTYGGLQPLIPTEPEPPKTDITENLLVVSLKILQKVLEQRDFVFELSDKPLDTYAICKFHVDSDLSFLTGSFATEYYENLAMEQIVEIILKKLLNNQKLKIYKLISHITVDKDTRSIVYFSNIRWYTREDKLKRIIKKLNHEN